MYFSYPIYFHLKKKLKLTAKNYNWINNVFCNFYTKTFIEKYCR